MDDSMVDPAFNLGPDPAQIPMASQVPTASKAPEPKPEGSSSKGMGFLIVPVMLIILLIAAGSYLIANKYSIAPTTSTTTVASPAASGNVVTGCPCLTEQQLAGILGVQVNQTNTFNANSIGVAQWEQESNQSSVFDSVSQRLKNGVTGVWLEEYASGTTQNDIQTASLNVYKVANASGFYQGFIASAFPKAYAQNQTGGFMYSYYENNFTDVKGQVVVVLAGYEGDYFVDSTFVLFQPNVRAQLALPYSISGILGSAL
jgi:hypothetical protein